MAEERDGRTGGALWGDRRPLASRGWLVFQRLAAEMDARRVSPNAISVAGMVCGVAAGVALLGTAHAGPVSARVLWVGAAALVQLRLVANLLDGMVAIGSGRATPAGELYNEVPDRVSDPATLVGFGYAAGGMPELGYVAALLALFTAYVRAVGKIAGAGSDFRGPMAKQQRMFVVTLTCLFMAVAPGAWTRGWCPAHAELGAPAAALVVVILGCVLTAWRRLARAGSRLRSGQ
jgi:phosphatidylglycerophosphate synthase